MSNIQICKAVLIFAIVALIALLFLIHREVGRLTREELDMMFDGHGYGEDSE